MSFGIPVQSARQKRSLSAINDCAERGNCRNPRTGKLLAKSFSGSNDFDYLRFIQVCGETAVHRPRTACPRASIPRPAHRTSRLKSCRANSRHPLFAFFARRRRRAQKRTPGVHTAMASELNERAILEERSFWRCSPVHPTHSVRLHPLLTFRLRLPSERSE